MALLFMDGFDHYTTPGLNRKWDYAGGSASQLIEPTLGRRGGGCLRDPGSSNCDLHKNLPGSPATVICGMAIYTTIASTSSNTGRRAFAFLGENLSTHIKINRESDGHFRAYRGDAGTLLGATTETTSLNEWNYIECKVVVHASAGSVELRKNGATIMNLTGVNTLGGTGAGIQRFVVGSNGTGSHNGYFDDIYVCDTTGTENNNFLGDVRIELLQADAVGTYNQFTAVPTAAQIAAAYTYWRIDVTDWLDASGGIYLTEIEMRATPGGADQCNGGTATSSFGTASSAFDNSLVTFLAFSTGAKWVQYQFPSPVVVQELALYPYPNYRPRRFTLSGSNDGVSFIQLGAWSVGAENPWEDSTWKTFLMESEIRTALGPRLAGTNTYLVGGAAGTKHSATLRAATALPASTDVVVALQINNQAGKSASGGASVRNFVRVGTSEAVGQTRALSTSHRVITSIHELNPATGVPWLLSEALTAQAGLEVMS